MRGRRPILTLDKQGRLQEQTDHAADRDYAEKIKSFGTLEIICTGDEQALRDLASLRAETSLRWYEPEAALVQLRKFPEAAQDRLGIRKLWLLQSANFLLGDKQGVEVASSALVDANEAALLASGNWRLVEKGTARRVDFRAYRPANDQMGWLFIVNPKDGSQLTAVYTVLSTEYSDNGQPILEIRHNTCDSEGYINPGKLKDVPVPAFEAVRAQVLGYFDGTVAPFQNDEGGPLDALEPTCLLAGKILPGLGDPYRYDGTEYRGQTQALTSAEAATWLVSPDSGKREKAVAHILAHPDAVEPFSYLPVITQLLESGKTEQAAFWYYVFQIRTYPWRKASTDPSGAPALYGSIRATLGQQINQWAGSDVDAWQDLMQRALSFERAAPLFPGHPDGVSAKQWQALIETGRAGFLPEEVRKQLSDKARFEEMRRKSGLYVGPWQAPGAPLPDNWR